MGGPGINFDAIPCKLKALAQWVLWKYDAPRPDGKRAKPPFMLNGKRAKVNDPATWGSFEAAKAALLIPSDASTPLTASAVLADGAGIVGIDLDNCVNADGSLTPLAQRFLDSLPTYWGSRPLGAACAPSSKDRSCNSTAPPEPNAAVLRKNRGVSARALLDGHRRAFALHSANDRGAPRRTRSAACARAISSFHRWGSDDK